MQSEFTNNTTTFLDLTERFETMEERRRRTSRSKNVENKTESENCDVHEGIQGKRTLRRNNSRESPTSSAFIMIRFCVERIAFVFLVTAILSAIYLVINTTWRQYSTVQPISGVQTATNQPEYNSFITKLTSHNNENVSSPKERFQDTKTTTSVIQQSETDNGIRDTCGKTSTYQLLNEPIHGGFLHVQVQARDKEGRPRHTGGDFWFATLSSQGSSNPPRPRGSTSGKVIDHNNGTYSIYFYLGWIGPAEINITLVHSKDAIRFLRNVYWQKDGKTIWNGYFIDDLDNEHGEKKSNHLKQTISECTIRRNDHREDACEYWFPQAMGQTVFVCRKPYPNFKCTLLPKIVHNIDASMRVTRYIAGDALKLFEGTRFATRLKNGEQTIELLQGNSDSLNITSKLISSRPLCKPGRVKKLEPRLSDGFWFNGNWTSLICHSTHWRNRDTIGTCLRNRELILNGDQTLHHWAVYITKMLQGETIEKFDKSFKIHRYFPAFNFTLNFISHPYIETKISQSFHDVSHTVQILEDRLRQNCDNDIITISPWAHFLQWSRESYEEKLMLIQQAVKKYLHKCPKTPVVIRGPHARHAKTLEERLFASNYTSFEWGEVMRATFADSGAWYMDVWDMYLSYDDKITAYKPQAIIKQEVDMFLSYACYNWS